MKKRVLLLIAIVLLACMFTACASFGKDPKQYAKTLENKGFYVEIFDKSNLYDFFDIYSILEDFEIEEHSSWIDYIVFCENEEEGYFFYCYDTASAKKIEKSLKDLMENYRGYADGGVLKRDGNIVYFGWEENWAEIK